MNIPEKTLNLGKKGDERKLIVSHETIRLSISVLLLRLVVTEIFAAIGFIAVYVFLTGIALPEQLATQVNTYTLPLFILCVFIKTFFVIFITIQWYSEYYEITPKMLIHRKGLLFKKEQRYVLNHLSFIEIDQGFFGRLFNYGTLKLFNWVHNKQVMLYLIHNPTKYFNILQAILPESDEEKQVLREHLLEEDSE